MKAHDPLWVMIGDERRCSLLCGGPTESGHWHFEHRGAIDNVHAQHQHGRPSPLSLGYRCAHAAFAHEDEELRRRFAKDAAAWLGKQVQDLHIARLVAFAPARLLGALRPELGPELAHRVEEHEGDLTGSSPAMLARHPVLADLICDRLSACD